MNRKFISVISLSILSCTAIAQQSPTNPGGFLNTDPRSPAYNPGLSAPPRPAERWADRWGAIAVDDATTGVGIAVDEINQSRAKSAAVRDCQSRGGGSGCQVKMAYRNQCGVLVVTENKYNTARAETVERAEELGVEVCRKGSGGSCRVYYSGCSLPVKLN